MHPVIVIDRIEEPAIQKWDFAVEAAIEVIVTLSRQRLIKKRFQDIVEEIFIRSVLLFE